jgi:2-keto-4-pentenoate hydratase
MRKQRQTMGMSLTEQAQSVAAGFVSARRAARALESYPGSRPTNLIEAYRIQDAAIALDRREIAGWKVGKINPPLDHALGANRLSGPIFADSIAVIAPGEVPQMPVFAGGFAAGEAELLLHIAPGWNGVVPADDAATRAVLDDVRLGIEIASSPYPGINSDGPLVTVSDYGNNHGLVIGAELPDWRDIDLCAIPVRTEIDGTGVGEGTAQSMLDGPYGAVRFLLANLASRAIALTRGLWVSSGAITGVHPVQPGQRVTAIFGDYGKVDCAIVAASGR